MKRRVFPALFFLICSVASAEQTSNVDSQLQKADNIKSVDPAALSDIIDELDDLKATFSRPQTAYYLFLKGYKLGITGQYSQAAETYISSLAIAEDIELRVKILTSYVNLLGVNREAAKGYQVAQQLWSILPQASDESRNAALTRLSIFYNQIEDYQAAINAASSVISSSEDPRSICYAYYTLVEAKYNLNHELEPGKIESYSKHCKKEGEVNVQAILNIYQARVLHDAGQSASAIELLGVTKPLLEITGYPLLEAWYYSDEAEIAYDMNNFDTAVVAAERVIEKTSNSSHSVPRVKALNVLAKYYETRDKEKAITYLKALHSAKLASLDETKARQLAIQQAKNDALEREIQIKLLDKENSLLKTEAALSAKELENSRLVITLLLMLGALVIVWLLVNRKMHKELRRQARTDKLTGILNRHYFTELAESNLRYHEKTSQTLALVVFDLDLFKRINDSYGHVTGDWALVEVTQVIKRVCRKQDILGRMGGEEFAMLLPGCTVDKAESLTESFRHAVEAIDTSPTGSDFTITASFGVTDTAQCGYKFDQLYACADEALYRSKNEGRNQVYCYDPSFQGNPHSMAAQPG
ncbi:diguanylate cyclase [Alteromonas sp. H39]|uniref:tetratricopeptide repeat-containing diguanylate cyclase n=1 Tax=Alteromonas sp. H39 TaxID=3389876 RepID=UPI0039DFFEB5